MIYPVVRTVFLLNILVSLAIIIVLVVPYTDSQLRAFVTDPQNCAGECLLGIRPGTTTVSEAVEYLQTNAWVESAQLSAPGTGYGQIRWLWSGQQPTLIDESYPGRITFYWDEEEINAPPLEEARVETISIATRIRMFTLQEWYGAPDSGIAGIRPDGWLGYSAAYHKRGTTVSMSSTIPCPVNLMSYWGVWAKLSISIGQGTSTYVPPTEMVKIC